MLTLLIAPLDFDSDGYAMRQVVANTMRARNSPPRLSCAKAALSTISGMVIARRKVAAAIAGLAPQMSNMIEHFTGSATGSSACYSFKVCQHWMRGSNQWCTPKVLWPGGRMTNAAVAQWIATP